jgi:hypothetical protein
MADYGYSLTPEEVVLSLWIKNDSYPLTGRTPTVALRQLENTGTYLDFSNNTWKTVGWVTRYQTLTSAVDGLYNYEWLPTGAITTARTIEAIYFNTGGTTTTAQVATDTLRFYNINPIVSVAGGGGGKGSSTVIQGVWTKKEKDKLFDTLQDIENNLEKVVSKVGAEANKHILDLKNNIKELNTLFNLTDEVTDELREFSRKI